MEARKGDAKSAVGAADRDYRQNMHTLWAIGFVADLVALFGGAAGWLAAAAVWVHSRKTEHGVSFRWTLMLIVAGVALGVGVAFVAGVADRYVHRVGERHTPNAIRHGSH
jgi:ABC-type spermidine/putrescine transport system permease subunit II